MDWLGRLSTLRVEPPLAMMTALLARILTLAPLLFATMPMTRPEAGDSLTIDLDPAANKLLGLKPGMIVCDLGAGTGYFSVRLARSASAPSAAAAQGIQFNAMNQGVRFADLCRPFF